MTTNLAPPLRPAAGVAAQEFERAHAVAVNAAIAGLSDAGLGSLRLAGDGVPLLAEAAVTSATPYLRAPILSRISAALRLHPPGGDAGDLCPTCGSPVPCVTAQLLS
jgi:hypothetical protein